MPGKTIEHVGGINLSTGGAGFAYGDALPIFEGLDIELKPGEFLAVPGPSGCGKNAALSFRGRITKNKSDNMEEKR